MKKLLTVMVLIGLILSFGCANEVQTLDATKERPEFKYFMRWDEPSSNRNTIEIKNYNFIEDMIYIESTSGYTYMLHQDAGILYNLPPIGFSLERWEEVVLTVNNNTDEAQSLKGYKLASYEGHRLITTLELPDIVLGPDDKLYVHMASTDEPNSIVWSDFEELTGHNRWSFSGIKLINPDDVLVEIDLW